MHSCPTFRVFWIPTLCLVGCSSSSYTSVINDEQGGTAGRTSMVATGGTLGGSRGGGNASTGTAGDVSDMVGSAGHTQPGSAGATIAAPEGGSSGTTGVAGGTEGSTVMANGGGAGKALTGGSAGVASGGSSNGGTTPSGGASAGGVASNGGTTPGGGVSTGGVSTRGVTTGGRSTGGANTGGVSIGGVSTGGVSTGGVSTGGAGTGGAGTGGAGTGGAGTGGAPLDCSGNAASWNGCRGSGCTACAELVADYGLYFVHNRNCSINTTCGGGEYALCSINCPAPAEIDRYGGLECAGATVGGWSGCRASGCLVCAEKLVGYPRYFVNHPDCARNDTCAGSFSTCSSSCPAPTAADQ